jgi:hypothetical protein
MKGEMSHFESKTTLGIVLASLGFLNPLLAAFIHVGSEMTFILNSARLLPRGERRSRAVEPRERTVVQPRALA